MAKAIQNIVQNIKSPEMVKQEALANLQTTVAENADALNQLLALTTALKDSGMLEMVLALLKQGDAILHKLVGVANQPGAAGSIKTLLTLVQGFSELDAVAVGETLTAASSGLKAMSEAAPVDRPLGVFDLMRAVKDPQVSAGLQRGLAFLRGFGQSAVAEEGNHQ